MSVGSCESEDRVSAGGVDDLDDVDAAAAGDAGAADVHKPEDLPSSEPAVTVLTATGTSTTAAAAVSKKEEGRRRKKDDKSYDHILRALSSLNTPEEKLAALCQKYADLFEDHRQQKDKLKVAVKRANQLQREKDQLQTEHSKVVLAKSKLENLCRELQRHNKVIKEESLARAKEEEEKRKEVSTKFQNTIMEVQSQMMECHTRNSKLQEENKELAGKLKGLIDQYEKREEHMDKVYKHKELESQLCEARLAQSAVAMEEAQVRHGAEAERLCKENTMLKKKIELLEGQEAALREQIQFYTAKYEEFQDTVSRSNDIFGSVKTEMDKMTKKVKKTEKEVVMWKNKFENSNNSVLKLAKDKADHEAMIVKLNAKITKLENLCRALQNASRGKSAESEGAETAATKPSAECTSTAAADVVSGEQSHSTNVTTSDTIEVVE